MEKASEDERDALRGQSRPERGLNKCPVPLGAWRQRRRSGGLEGFLGDMGAWAEAKATRKGEGSKVISSQSSFLHRLK